MARPVAQTANEVGLLAGGQPIPLEGVRIEAAIQDFCSRVTVTQRYVNRESHPIEVVYVFPLDEAAAVSGFAALVEDVEIVGEVKERDEAFDRYDEAIADGYGAYLLDQEKPDVFVASIGNLPSGKEALVKLTYVAELTREGEDIRFVLPTTVSPRFAPPEDHRGVGQPLAERVNPPVAWSVPYGLELTVSIEMASAVRSVESPSHPIAVEMDGASATVRLGERQTSMDRDFVLLIGSAEPEVPRVWLEENPDGELSAMVVLQPKLDAERAPCEAIFLVDRSGSMEGTSITEARNALQLSLRSLSEESFFNIVGFGSRHEMLFPKSVPYTEQNLTAASRHLDDLRADLGGTMVLPALEAVLSEPARPGLPRQLFLLTDGQVTNTEAVIDLVRQHAHTTRVFTFGIGAGASHHLVRGIARAGEGAAELIYPGERIESKVLRQLKRALTPALTDLRIDWGGLRVKQAPFHVPPVFADGKVVVYGLLERKPGPNDTEIRLRATSPAGEVAFSAPFGKGRIRPGNLIATLAARVFLRDLEEGRSALHVGGSLQQRRVEGCLKEEAVRIGVKYGLASRWTSFVAVEKRETPVQDPMELRRVPVALTRGWGGAQEPPCAAGVLLTGTSGPAASAPRMSFGDSVTGSFALEEMAFALESFSTGTQPGFEELIRLQGVDGSWDLTRGFAKAIGVRFGKLKRALPAFTGERDVARRAWATALAVHWLDRNAADRRDAWSLLETKAKSWLKRCESQPAGGEDWLVVAERFLGA